MFSVRTPSHVGYEYPTPVDLGGLNLNLHYVKIWKWFYNGKIGGKLHIIYFILTLLRIPHYFGMKVPPLIRNSQEIREKMALLEALGDIQAALSVLGQPSDSDLHPVDQQYFNLKCDLTLLGKESGDFKVRIHPPFIMKWELLTLLTSFLDTHQTSFVAVWRLLNYSINSSRCLMPFHL